MNIYIWGRGEYGALGLGDERNRLDPSLLDTDTGDDKLEWIQIECGNWHTVGLTKNGDVLSWGENRSGQLGHGDWEDRRVPKKVEVLDEIVIIKILCGADHTAAITDKGELLTWGGGVWGQLGHMDTLQRNCTHPKKVEALADEVIVDVACGEYHTCVVTSTGTILTWGGGIVTGHVEDRVLLPRLLADLSSQYVVSVSANHYHTACVTKDGEVFTWGIGQYGRLGHGDENDQPTPKRVEALVGVKATTVSCGLFHTAVCTEDGRMHTFGQGEEGQLGHGDRENKSSPTLVQALVGKHITQVQCGVRYTMALASSGYVFTWGSSEYGALGHGNIKPKCLSFPCLVEGLREHNVVHISGGFDHCAVLVDSTNPCDIRQSQQASFNNVAQSDVIFIVDNESLYSNIKVLTQKSDYFAAMFLRSSMRESIERVVQVPNFSKAAFLLMLEYIHLDGFTVSMDDVVELWEVADFYQLEGLKYCCMGTLERGLCEENISQILKEAEELSCPCDELKNKCHEYLKDQMELKNRKKET